MSVKFIKLAENGGKKWDRRDFPSTYELFIETIKNKYKIDNINEYKIKDFKLGREINNQKDYELMSKTGKQSVNIIISKINKESNIQVNNLNNNAPNKIATKINNKEVDKELNLNIQSIKEEEKEKKNKEKNKNLLEDLKKQIKYLDDESLNTLSDVIQEEIDERKINKIK